jgi:hypothetical protein
MSRLNNTKSALLLLCCTLLFACKQKVFNGQLTQPSPYFTQLIDVQDPAVLRGVSFGLNAEEVKDLEKAKLFEAAPDHLFYEFTYAKDSTEFSEYVNISYYFDETDVLDVITMDIFLSDTLQVKELQRTFTEFYTQQYGQSDRDDYQYDVWDATHKNVKSGNKEAFSIALKPIEHEIGLSLEFLRTGKAE